MEKLIKTKFFVLIPNGRLLTKTKNLLFVTFELDLNYVPFQTLTFPFEK